MCGIIGMCISQRFSERVKASMGELLTRGLKCLEYRGYDSVGIAVSDGREIVVRKGKGKVDEVSLRLGFRLFDGKVGVAHTRWATHGEPNDRNAHPHCDCSGRVAVVHNGIIRNFISLRKELAERHVFRSDTDTEVVAHLIEEFLSSGAGPFQAFKQAVKRLEGSYALAVIVGGESKIFFAKRESPLVIGLCEDAKMVASDIPALLPYTKLVVPLDDNEVGWVSESEVFIERLDTGEPIDLRSRALVVEWRPEMVTKGGYEHFMLKEIHEQPQAVRSTIDGALSDDSIDRAADALASARNVFIAAAGTSYHAGLVIKYFLERTLRRPVYAFISSEYRHHSTLAMEGDILLAISQSGETIDTLKSVRAFKARGARALALTNVLGSAIYREADLSVITRAGPEIGVAATKTFLTQVAIGEILSIKVGVRSGALRQTEAMELVSALEKAPSITSGSITLAEPRAALLSEELKTRRSMYVLGRGLGVPLAMEGALKVKEVAYIHAEAYPAGESKHGPIALVEEGFPVIFVVTGDSIEEIVSNVMEMNARNALTIAVSARESEAVSLARQAIFVDTDVHVDLLEPFALVPPLQLLAYYIAIRLGLDPDKPRNLAKTVTVE